jgi:hypothetical protein
LESKLEVISHLFKRVWKENEDRDEIQEYLNKPLKEAVMDKLEVVSTDIEA